MLFSFKVDQIIYGFISKLNNYKRNTLGYLYVEKYTLILNEQDVREWIGFMCQERATSGLF